MKVFCFRKGKWEERPLPLPFAQSQFRPAKLDPQGREYEGKLLIDITWDEAALADGKFYDIYLIPATAAIRPPTWPQRLLAVNLAAHDTFLHIWVYCPHLRMIPEETPRERIVRFGKEITVASRYRADIFLGPEYFFTKSSHSLEEPGSADHCYSTEDRNDVEKAVRGAGLNHPGMLIIPGTVLWKDEENVVRNTAFLHYRSTRLFLTQSKRTQHNDQSFAVKAGGHFIAGAAHHLDFSFRELKVRYQICADTGSDPEEMVDLHLLSGYGIGAPVPRAHAGGYLALSDGLGRGRLEKTQVAFTASIKPPGEGDSFSSVVHIRKRV